MTVRDSIGNPVAEGDLVATNVGNELGVGRVVAISSGLVNNPNEQPQPLVAVQLVVQRPVLPNGQTVNVLLLKTPEKEAKLTP